MYTHTVIPQCCGSGSALIHIHLNVLDPIPDQYSYWECGSGSTSMEIYQNFQIKLVSSLKKGFFTFARMFLTQYAVPTINIYIVLSYAWIFTRRMNSVYPPKFCEAPKFSARMFRLNFQLIFGSYWQYSLHFASKYLLWSEINKIANVFIHFACKIRWFGLMRNKGIKPFLFA